MRWLPALALALGAAAASGCTTLGYYAQAAAGQAAIIVRSRDIDGLIDDPRVDGRLRQRLQLARDIRAFAGAELALPENGSYDRYADTGREHVLWNVVAAPVDSVEPLNWCFPIAGCVAYRGYFSEASARRFADALAARGFDVLLAPVDAYSTLGWLADPLLNTFIDYPEAELAALVFHELSHELLYVKDDTVFNESFATAVERAGLGRWIESRGGDVGGVDGYRRGAAFNERFVARVAAYRDELRRLYASGLDAGATAEGKQRLLDALYNEYVALWRERFGDATPGLKRDAFNNALVASLDLYYRFVPAFESMLAEAGSLGDFYASVRRLADLDRDARHRRLEELSGAGD